MSTITTHDRLGSALSRIAAATSVARVRVESSERNERNGRIDALEDLVSRLEVVANDLEAALRT